MLADIINETIRSCAPQMAKSIESNALLAQLMKNMPPPKPLTLWQRVRFIPQRIKDAFRVLRGRAEICECDD